MDSQDYGAFFPSCPSNKMSASSSFPSLRIVFSRAPEDSPHQDLHIWTPAAGGAGAGAPVAEPFEAWWTRRDKPVWVGIDAAQCTAFAELYAMLSSTTAPRIVVYAGELRCDDTEEPCGCTVESCGCRGVLCEYHRGATDVALCGCSRARNIACEFHGE
jgi:hypothetical protein